MLFAIYTTEYNEQSDTSNADSRACGIPRPWMSERSPETHGQAKLRFENLAATASSPSCGSASWVFAPDSLARSTEPCCGCDCRRYRAGSRRNLRNPGRRNRLPPSLLCAERRPSIDREFLQPEFLPEQLDRYLQRRLLNVAV